MKKFTILLFLALIPVVSWAQKYSVSTNAMQYVNFVTVNAELSMAVSRHWSVDAGARYNPFKFKLGKDHHDVTTKQRTFYAGARYWPWNVYSGWWVAGKAQMSEYNFGGLFKEETREGDRYGLGAAVGYSYMLSKHFNIEFGLGIWGGYDKFVKYTCPTCGVTKSSGEKAFILPDDVMVAFSYIF